MGFHYQYNGQQFGPVSTDQLRTLVQQGQLAPHELVWAEGTPQWVSAGSVLGLAGSASVMPPRPGSPPPVAFQHAPVVQVVLAQQGKSRVAFVLLGLFLGGLGIHNFYAGYTGRAVAQLLIMLFTGWLIVPIFIVGLWALIEVITVTTDSAGVQFS